LFINKWHNCHYCFLRKNKIYFAHVGDSAAVIAQTKNGEYVAKELTVDHRPESHKEKSRLVH